MKTIHTIQHPPTEECSTRRLLVLNMKSNTFEGSGSLIKQFMIALAQVNNVVSNKCSENYIYIIAIYIITNPLLLGNSFEPYACVGYGSPTSV
jgi:hypothetical protein